MPSNSEIIKYLTSKTLNAGFVDKLKIKYRPIICPFNTLLEYAKGKKTAFDIGCGSGQFVSLLAKYTDLQEIYGIEISERLVKNAIEVNEEFKGKKKIEFNTFDGKIFPASISTCDIVYLIDVIHHVPQKQQLDFLNEIYTQMKPGAVLIFKDIDASHPFVYCNKVHDIVFAGEIGKELKFEYAKSEMERIGFRILESYTQTLFVYPHYFLICEKP